MNFHVNLCLTVHSVLSTPVEYSKRFPVSLCLNWWDLTPNAPSLQKLSDWINGQIIAQCKPYIEQDIGRKGAQGVLAFSASTWNPLGGGQHEYSIVPISIYYGPGDTPPWLFVADDGTTIVPMLAGARVYQY